MLNFLTMFLAPAVVPPQATMDSRPAVAEAAHKRIAPMQVSWKLVASVLGNAAGFLVLLGGCWLVLQVIRALLPV